jgi:hypothetical protein
MQRREFIGGILWSTLFARLGFAQGLDKTLLSLAQVIIPDRKPEVWVSSDVATALAEEIERLPDPQKAQIITTLNSLDSVASSQKGKNFHKLSLHLRTSLVKEQIKNSDELKQGFTTVRAAAIKCFYGSSLGHQRTGYRKTNQFEGYPEHQQGAETWE